MFVHVSANLANLEEVLKINRVVGAGGVMFFFTMFCRMFHEAGGGGKKNLLTTSRGLPKNVRGKTENHHSPHLHKL